MLDLATDLWDDDVGHQLDVIIKFRGFFQLEDISVVLNIVSDVVVNVWYLTGDKISLT